MIATVYNIFSDGKPKLWDREKAWQQFKEMNDEAIERQRAIVEGAQDHRLSEAWVERESERELYNDQNKM